MVRYRATYTQESDSPPFKTRGSATLRQAITSDISGIQRVRHSVHENRLVSTSISDRQVREAIEITGRGWVIE